MYFQHPPRWSTVQRNPRRKHVVFLLSSTILILFFISYQARRSVRDQDQDLQIKHRPLAAPAYDWARRHETYPVTAYEPIPPPGRRKLPRIQHRFGCFTGGAQHARREAVKQAFLRCWNAYREHAWMKDELRPVSGQVRDHFAGWAATLVDSLDTLWIMGLHEDFEEAVEAVMTIDFSITKAGEEISLFETTIRYLGGLLAAYDLSGDIRLLAKAVELGNTLYGAFDTPNRMPATYWDLMAAKNGTSLVKQTADRGAIVADIGSLTLEFTRLSQLTGDPKWYDATYRIMSVFAAQQNQTNLPGMWPMQVDAMMQDFYKGSSFSVGALCDSLYEYLLKMVPLLGGSEMYQSMYSSAVETIIDQILLRPMVPDSPDILLPGKAQVLTPGQIERRPEAEHLSCFLGGLLALGSRLLHHPQHILLGRKLTDGCIWAYDASPLGIMPEDFSFVPCSKTSACGWNETLWLQGILALQGTVLSSDSLETAVGVARAQNLPLGFTGVTNRHYILRPEALESVFVLYRITGDGKLRDDAWRMFGTIQNATRIELANSALSDVTDAGAAKLDEMESFWLAETLKYLYLIFSEPDLISLDDYVFNTEAHPLRRPKVVGGGWWWWGWW